MPEALGLDTPIPPSVLEDRDGHDADRSGSQRRRRKPREPDDDGVQRDGPEPAEGVGTRLDVTA